MPSPGLSDPARIHGMGMSPRFTRGPSPTVSTGYASAGGGPRLVYAAKPGSPQVSCTCDMSNLCSWLNFLIHK